LHAATTAGVTDFCCFDVIFLNRLEKGERLEAIDQLGSVFRPSKALQQLLEDQSCREDLICPQKCMAESHYLGRGLLNITAQSQ
jgi:hypothetical protein